jgi:hypothetical protein
MQLNVRSKHATLLGRDLTAAPNSERCRTTTRPRGDRRPVPPRPVPNAVRCGCCEDAFLCKQAAHSFQGCQSPAWRAAQLPPAGIYPAKTRACVAQL